MMDMDKDIHNYMNLKEISYERDRREEKTWESAKNQSDD